MVDWNALDYSMSPAGYRELRTAAVRVTVPALAYFKLWGGDHRIWLQGQVTNDLGFLSSSPWLDTCLTKPTGQLLAIIRCWEEGDHLVLATEGGKPLQERVETSVILEDASLSRVETAFECIQGPLAPAILAGYPSDRTGSGGYETPDHSIEDLPYLSPEGYSLSTLEAGIPLRGVDYTDRTLPPELGPHFESQHVSYTKGCYVGQEVLMRIKARGHTNKTWVGLKAQSAIPAGARVTFDSREVGTVHRAAFSPAFGYIASATLKNEATREGAIVQVGDTKATVVEMPFLR